MDTKLARWLDGNPDKVSKVVDENGEPLVVYQASNCSPVHVGTYTHKKLGIEVEIRRHGIKEAINHGSGPDKVRALAAIPRLIEDGVLPLCARR